MISTIQQFNNTLYIIFIGQIIMTTILIILMVKYLLKKRREEPSEKEIKKLIEKE